MNENLPDIGFKEKKEKKGGALGWLRNKLGFGTRGAIGEAGINPSAMNVGRAIGAGKFGASSSGIAGLLAGGKLGTVLTVAVMAAAVGTTLVMRSQNSNSPTSAAFNSDRAKTNSEYVPAILRNQAANQGSSLDMFKETNKGAGLAMETDPSKANKPPEPKSEDAAANAEAQAQDPNQPAPGAGNMAGDMMAKLQGGEMASMTSSLGGGSNKFSNMGGFSNKFGSGATGGKTGFSSGIGSGFSAMPKFDQRKGKMMAMKGAARPVFGGSKAGKRGTFGSGAFNQAKGLRATQKQFSGTNIDSARSTQDKAWEGSTGEGDAGGGAGLSDGGAGVVTSPSLDNTTSSGGGGGTDTPDASAPDANPAANVSPWASQTMMAMMLILAAALLAGIGAKLIKMGDAMIAEGTPMLSNPYTAAAGAALVASGTSLRGIGMALAGVAIALGAIAMIMGIMIMQQHGQQMLGTVYTIGAGCAVAAGVMAMTGTDLGPVTPIWMAAAAGIITLIGSMLGGK